MKKKFILPFLLCGALLILPSCGETVKEDDTNLDDNKTKQKMKAVFDDGFKSYYLIGEALSYDNLRVIDARNSKTLSDYTITPEEGTIVNELGDISVEVSKDGYQSFTFDVHVVEELPPEEEEPEYTTIEIYSINDFHGSFIENGDNGEIGMSKLGAYLKDRKDEESIVISAGDMWQGGVESNLTHGKIIVDAMNYIGFDAMTVGNHEFDWGFDVLEENISNMDFPMLAANAIDKRTGEEFPYFEPYTIVETKDVKVGIIGTGAESLPTDITYSVSKYLEFKGQVSTAKTYSDYLKTEEDCDLVILAAHDGASFDYGQEPIFFESLTEISGVSGERYVDAMFLGHDHDTKNGKINGVPYAEGGSNGKGVSRISFSLAKENDEYKIITSNANVISPYSSGYFNKEDSYINSLLDKYSDELAQADRVICSFSETKSKNDILELVCDAMIAYANDPKHESILIDDQKVTAAFHNTGGVRDSAESGDFTYRDLIKVLPFDNTYCIAKLTDGQFDAWNNSSNYYKGSKGSGKYTYVATINYLADNPDYSPSEEVFNTNIVIQDIFIEYLEANDGSF